MKKTQTAYEEALIEILFFDVADIVTSSGNLSNDDNSPSEDGGWTRPGGIWS